MIHLVDGKYGPWTSWGECSVTCEKGVRISTRKCTPPKHGGKDCQGPSQRTMTCVKEKCKGKLKPLFLILSRVNEIIQVHFNERSEDRLVHITAKI